MEFTHKNIDIQLFNSESKSKEKVIVTNDLLKIYTCGPTIYNFAHIGNFRTYVFEDLLCRLFRNCKYNVDHVMNITDVDDKTIKGALERNIALTEFTTFYEKAFFEDLKSLHIYPANHYPRATDYIPQMVKAIEELVEKGFAYQGNDKSVYFSIAKMPSYGRLSCCFKHSDSTGEHSRITNDEYDKDNIGDFVLWKALDKERDGYIYWESSFGPGRPGWHIECSVMAREILGDCLDIHAGGVDNMFPHHENEIAQSESLTGKLFVKIWLHSEHLLVDNKKMSKSLGNFYVLRDLLEMGFTGYEIRYALIQVHYRKQLNFSIEDLKASAVSLKRINDFIARIQDISENNSIDQESTDISNIIESTFDGFYEFLRDDLNISGALASLFDFIRNINLLADQEKISNADADNILKLLENFNEVLALYSLDSTEIPEECLKLLEERNIARSNKDWSLSDKIRDELLAKGFAIKDTKNGQKLQKL